MCPVLTTIFTKVVKHDTCKASILLFVYGYMFHADCCCGCCWIVLGWPIPPPIPVDNDGNAGIWGSPALAAVEPVDGAIKGETVAPASLGNLSLKFFNKWASHRCTDSSLLNTLAKDWSRSASGRHWRSASRALELHYKWSYINNLLSANSREFCTNISTNIIGKKWYFESWCHLGCSESLK